MSSDVTTMKAGPVLAAGAPPAERCCIEPGVRMVFDGVDGGTDRIQLSHGTTGAPATGPGPAYEEFARIPASEWRPPTKPEEESLLSRRRPDDMETTDMGTVVAIIQIPPELLDPFNSLQGAATTFSRREDVIRFVSAVACRDGIAIIKKYIREHFTDDGEPEGGIVVKQPKLATVTTNPRNGLLVGVHLDDWYRLPIERRHQSPNRICVNIGCEDRYFLFLNLPIRRVHDVLSNAEAKVSFAAKGGTAVGRSFMTQFPAYPIVRVRIRPGEAYMAPTENVLHDGSSVEMSTFDLSLSFRGHFSLLHSARHAQFRHEH